MGASNKPDTKKAGSQESDDQKKVINEGPEPNLVYVGEPGYEQKRIENGMGKPIIFPADQSKPFYHEQASVIIQALGDQYKLFKKKGE